MNKAYLGMISILVCASICVGQSSKKQNSPPLADGTQKDKQLILMSDTQIDAELQKTLDVNRASVGDQVVLKTTKTIKQDGQVVIRKGSNVIGRITAIQRRTKENGESKIGMIFERIQGSDLSTPISASIVSITNAAARVSAGDSLTSDVSGTSQTSATTTQGGSGGGGLLGGVGNTVGGLVGTTAQTVGAATNTVGQAVGTTTGTVGRTLDGIRISTSASGSASSSTTLSSPNKNLRVEKGASFNLLVDSRRRPQE